MTHDELLICVNMNAQTTGGLEQNTEALRAAVELHKPIETYNMNNVHKSWFTCTHCNDEIYPCPTIQAIEAEL